MRRAQGGFTLLELIIAMVLVSLVMVLLFGGLRLGLRSWDAATERATRTDDMRLAAEFIRRVLGGTRLVYWETDRGRHLAFEGEADAVRFVAPVPAHLGMGGVHVVTLALGEAAGAGQVLNMSYWPLRPEMKDFKADGHAETETLVSRVTRLGLKYFGAAAPGEDPEWRDSWKDARTLPELVELDLETEEGPWPVLIVALK